jgi:hypothetical protein
LGIALFKTYPPRTFKTFFRAGGEEHGKSIAGRGIDSVQNGCGARAIWVSGSGGT